MRQPTGPKSIISHRAGTWHGGRLDASGSTAFTARWVMVLSINSGSSIREDPHCPTAYRAGIDAEDPLEACAQVSNVKRFTDDRFCQGANALCCVAQVHASGDCTRSRSVRERPVEPATDSHRSWPILLESVCSSQIRDGQCKVDPGSRKSTYDPGFQLDRHRLNVSDSQSSTLC